MAESGPSIEPVPQATVGVPQAVAEKMKATFLGQCVGDALGLLTEFLTKEEAIESYGKNPKTLKYSQKVKDFHRNGWKVGDWTDDTDQMILILQSLLYNKGQVDATDFAKRMVRWMRKGFPELGDYVGCGVGSTTRAVLHNPEFITDPHKVASEVWQRNHRNIAPNGSVMRTSILGMHQWQDIEKVIENALCIGKTTHHDPRCQAAVVAVTTCIAQMLQHAAGEDAASKSKAKKLPIDNIIKCSYDMACRVLETDDQKKELWKHMSCKKLKQLELCEEGKIGYTYKCMGSGFWALKQSNFEKAMIELVMEGGDADTNGAVAGSMLACKLGLEAIPEYWISDLRYKEFIMDLYNRFITLQSQMSFPIEKRISSDDLSIAYLNAYADKLRRDKEVKKEDVHTS